MHVILGHRPEDPDSIP